MKVDELEAALQLCQDAGAKIVQEVTHVRPGFRIAFFMAPDNVLVELVEMK
jgi:predicted enzyme related to lactoylglutathione lyase